MSLSKKFRGAAVVVAVAAMALTGCSSSDDETTSAAPTTSGDAAPALETFTEGKLTIATGEPAFSPWVLNDAPESGEGFEAAVAYAVAEELGFAKEDVVWVRTPFESAIAPGPKDWDFNIQQFSITEDRKAAVDFSSPYYTTSQAVLTTEGSKAAGAASIADLTDLTVGVSTGSTSYTTAVAQLGEDHVQVFNTNDDVVAALTAGQIDALVIDLPSAFYLRDAVLDGGKIIGQLPDSTEGGDQYGLLLAKDSPLTAAVTAAVDALTADGTLAALEEQWLNNAENVPVLQ
ncbi:ABC transporter substrate-binding protein [Demequina sp.]|uniref:ABC transporter substrate-binding protein n=1 Tax=Demequina sp. TaxID=2050685 RepID=UPI003D0A8F26